jgi:hypothetical protein
MLKAIETKKKRKRDSSMSEMYALKKKLQVEIVFPVSPFLSIDGLHQHWERGILPWDTYLQHACAVSGLPYHPMPEPVVGQQKDGSIEQSTIEEDLTEDENLQKK